MFNGISLKEKNSAYMVCAYWDNNSAYMFCVYCDIPHQPHSKPEHAPKVSDCL